MTISLSEIEAEESWMRQWGLVPPSRFLLLSDPWRQPFGKRSLIVPHTWYETAGRTPQPVNAKALSADLRLLTDVLAMAYCGWETQGYSDYWVAFCAGWCRELGRRTEAVAPAAISRKWRELQRLRRDHHTGPVLAGCPWQSYSRVAVLPPEIKEISAYRSGGKEFAIEAGDAARQPWTARRIRPDFEDFEPVSLIASPFGIAGEPGPVDAVLAGGAWVNAQPLEMPARDGSIRAICGQNGDEPVYSQLAAGVGYLRIPTLSLRVSESIACFEECMPKDTNVERALVVDLRGNRGGAASSAIDLLTRLLGRRALERGSGFGFKLKKSCITDALSWGHAQEQLIEARPPLSSAARAQLQSILDGIGASPDNGSAISFEGKNAKWNYSQRNRCGPARVLVLTDGDCGSDGEFLTCLLASVPASIVVGQNTAGCAQFIRPGYFILPETRLVFRVATGMSNLYGDGRAFDGFGLQADVVLPRDTMLDCERLLKLVGLVSR